VTIGVTGAAGFLGAVLVRHLHGSGPPGGRLRLFCGRRAANPLTEDLGLEYEPLDVTAREEVFCAMRGVDLLVHLAGAVDYSRRGKRHTWDVNVLGTRNVLDAARANGVGKVVCVSSISVLGVAEPGLAMADESNDRYATGRNPVSFASADAALEAVEASLRGDYRFLDRVRVPYFDSKLASFELAMRAATRDAAPVVLALPGTAVGAGDTGAGMGALVKRVCEGSLLFTLPGGTSFVSAPDVARGLALALQRGRPGQAYILSGTAEDNLSYADFMGLVARVAAEDFGIRCRQRFVAVPAPLARAAARISESLAPSGALTEGLALSGSVTHRFGSAKAARELDYEPAVPLRESVRAFIASSRAGADASGRRGRYRFPPPSSRAPRGW
jgi:dihydroflavonol-4-reductase